MKKLITVILMLLAVSGAYAQTQVLAAWTAVEPASTYPVLAVASNAANVIAGTLSASGLTADTTSPGFWSWQGWANGSTTPELTKYWEFTLTPAVGKKMQATLLGITLDYIINTYGPTSWVVRTSMDNYTASAASFSTVRSTSALNYTAVITGVSNQTQAVTFRVYGFDNYNSTARRCGISTAGPAKGDIYVEGTISAAGPPPGSIYTVR